MANYSGHPSYHKMNGPVHVCECGHLNERRHTASPCGPVIILQPRLYRFTPLIFLAHDCLAAFWAARPSPGPRSGPCQWYRFPARAQMLRQRCRSAALGCESRRAFPRWSTISLPCQHGLSATWAGESRPYNLGRHQCQPQLRAKVLLQDMTLSG